MKKTLFGYLRERAGLGDAVFFSSHSLSEVEDLCDSVAFLRDGKLVEHETLAHLSARARKHVMVQYAGDRTVSVEDAPGCVSDVRVVGNGWEGILCGDVGEFLRWSSGESLSDVTISPPDLDRLFHTYYRSDGKES